MEKDNPGNENGREKSIRIIQNPGERRILAGRYLDSLNGGADLNSDKWNKLAVVFKKIILDGSAGSEKTREGVADFFKILIVGSNKENEIPKKFVVGVLGDLADSSELEKGKGKVIDVLGYMIEDKDRKGDIKEDFKQMMQFVDPTKVGLYDGKSVVRDMITVINIENSYMLKRDDYKANVGKSGEFLEKYLAETQGLFGDSSFVSRSLLFDDLCSATDLCVEYKRPRVEQPRMLLSIDCTINPNYRKISEKIERNIYLAKSGYLRMVKYSKPHNLDDPDHCHAYFPVVIGLQEKTFDMIKDKIPDGQQKIKVMQVFMLEQIFLQLNYYQNKMYFSRNEKTQERLDKLLEIIEKELKSKKEKILGNDDINQVLDLIKRDDDIYGVLRDKFHY